jgi:hypothetical protein
MKFVRTDSEILDDVRTPTTMERKAKRNKVTMGATTYHFFEITQRRKQK